jgi:hypothetical protein
LEGSGDKLVRLSVYVSEDKRAKFKAACAIRKISMNQVISDFLDEWLDEKEPPTSGISSGKGRGKKGVQDD